MNILVADDRHMIVEDLIDELRKIIPDARIEGTSDPGEIIGMCRDINFDVVFIDIEMPGRNGISIAKDLLKKHPKINIIYITAYEQYAVESYDTFASAFLVKPISSSKLKNALKNLRHPVSDITDEQITEQYAGSTLVGKKIEKYRKERDLSRSELAELMGVAMPTVYRWETGIRIPDMVTIMKLARVLGVKYDKFLDENDL
ncbi:MAG: response regulator [Ruminiclostridium sp.]|nr:response regulator [Ruminiclostridium sp.]